MQEGQVLASIKLKSMIQYSNLYFARLVSTFMMVSRWTRLLTFTRMARCLHLHLHRNFAESLCTSLSACCRTLTHVFSKTFPSVRYTLEFSSLTEFSEVQRRTSFGNCRSLVRYSR